LAQALEILVGVAGSISAYKAADVVSALKKSGAGVTVLMTPAAERFVSPLALAALSGRPVGLDLFNEPAQWGVGHVTLAKRAQAFLIVGATADLMAKLASGLAGDFVTAAALVARCPLVLAPAMHTEMWDHPATRKNAGVLLERGWHFVGPVEGPLSSGDYGMGRLADPLRIAEETLRLAAPARQVSQVLQGRRFLITAGPTREPLDPVRFLSNPSSGRMGYALAAAALRRGAAVTLVSGPVELEAPHGAEMVKVETALQMQQACQKYWPGSDVLVAAAAVSDWRPAAAQAHKTKKGAAASEIKLVANPDILAGLAADKGRRLAVGFAAETRDLLENARKKLQAKNLDMVVANLVGQAGSGFAAADNKATLVWPGREPLELDTRSKAALAESLLDEIENLIGQKETAS
jgi:phosphopantothenoylcysteine decarboxylase/phosphopantothenate--cysteine ligase